MVVGVNISSFRFKKKNTKKEEFIPFYSDFSKNKKDCAYSCENVIKVIEEFYKSKILPEQLDYHKKYFGTKKDSFKIEEKNDRIYISFTVICGAYGIKSEITDIDTNEILFKRKINNADVKDFRIMFAFAKNQKGFEINKGVVLFEVIGQYGVKTLKEDTEISIQYLPEEDVKNLKAGVEIIGHTKLIEFLEDYE